MTVAQTEAGRLPCFLLAYFLYKKALKRKKFPPLDMTLWRGNNKARKGQEKSKNCKRRPALLVERS